MYGGAGPFDHVAKRELWNGLPEWNGGSNLEWVYLFAEMHPDQLEIFLEIASQSIFDPRFEDEVLRQQAKIVIEEFLPIKTVDFTASAQRIIKAMKDIKGQKYLFLNWAGKGSPLNKFHAMKLNEKYGIQLTTGGNILPVLKGYKPFAGMEGSGYYYHTNPHNEMNDWLITEHKKRFKGMPPDFFTCGGFAAAMFVAKAIESMHQVSIVSRLRLLYDECIIDKLSVEEDPVVGRGVEDPGLLMVAVVYCSIHTGH